MSNITRRIISNLSSLASTVKDEFRMSNARLARECTAAYITKSQEGPSSTDEHRLLTAIGIPDTGWPR